MKMPKHSLKVDRFKRILHAVDKHKRVSLSGLENMLDASRITIQRDLVELEKRNLLTRFHGGAMSMAYSGNLKDHSIRKTINIEVKRAIASKAVSLVKPGSYIGMDASSTVYYMSECDFPKDVFILTPGIDTFTNLSLKENLQVVLSGGRLNKKTNTLAGAEALEMIKKFRFDFVFVSAESYIPGSAFFDPYEDEVLLKRALIESAVNTVMLLDTSKIAAAGGIKLCENDEVNCLITDKPNNRELKKVFKGRLLL